MTEKDHRTGDAGDGAAQPQHGDQDQGEQEQPRPQSPHGDQDEGEAGA